MLGRSQSKRSIRRLDLAIYCEAARFYQNHAASNHKVLEKEDEMAAVILSPQIYLKQTA
jgi:hypothetical protein